MERLVKVEKAVIADAVHVHRIVNRFAEKGEMLPRALGDIYSDIRDYFIAREGERVTACAALHIYWSDLAEIRAVAVDEDCQRQGVGAKLVQACLDEAAQMGIPTVFCLTYKPAFFEKLGFRLVDKQTLPRKIWAECYHCPKFPDCDEIALVYERPNAREGKSQ